MKLAALNVTDDIMCAVRIKRVRKDTGAEENIWA
jgi:hypothetical protein